MNKRILSAPLAMWGGVECTVNRVGEHYLNQLEYSGHAIRIDDLDRIAELGIKTLRYPVLWELIAPHGIEQAEWQWADERLARLQQLGITPIVGLLHHGSGPRDTSLIDPLFPEKFAQYAGTVARRYPHLEYYTPINEPLTTARFSALYGHWYPHLQNDKTFITALFNQIRATVLAMQAIREINPHAKLVQTDDLGKTYSTPQLAYQADFENERRWLSWDLLFGRVDEKHPMWSYLTWAGVTEQDILWFADNPCPPDVVGINYYITSERFLDERTDRYCLPEGNFHLGRRYADVEAVRVLTRTPPGINQLLDEAWNRYKVTLAITEAHIGCTREEQIRWLNEIWHAALAARDRGVDICAVTAWALLGSYNWNTLVTQDVKHYEPSVFDVRGGSLRPTAIANFIKDICFNNTCEHPALNGVGWWRRPERLLYPPIELTPPQRSNTLPLKRYAKHNSVILITGATGTLGTAFARICSERGLSFKLLCRQELDIADEASVINALKEFRPWAVINTAGYVRVDDAEADFERCFRENTKGPVTLAKHCATSNIKLLSFSSDLVFNGRSPVPYMESAQVSPLNVYGRSKAQAESQILDILPSTLIVRTSAFFGPWDKYNFVTLALQALATGNEFFAADDLVISPTYVPDLVHACLDLLIDNEHGIWHLANDAQVTWFDLASQAAQIAKLNARQLHRCNSEALKFVAPRPRYSALSSERSKLLPSLDNALMRYVQAVNDSIFANTAYIKNIRSG